MIEIKEGLDLDRAVAEAVGLVCTHRVLGSEIQFFSDPSDPLPGLITFKPSIDLNDAFRAAEVLQLFDGRWVGKLVSGWTIMELKTMNVVGPDRGCATQALAICAAIMKVKCASI